MAVAALIPWFHLVLFGAFVLRAYLRLGHWPSFNHPDPKQLGFRLHHMVVMLSMIPALYSPLVVAPLVIVYRKPLRAARDLSVYVLGTIVAWSVWGLDLGGFAEWLVD